MAAWKDVAGSRYLGFLSFAINYRIGGLDVFGYHLVNLIIHIANGFLVLSFLWVFLKAYYPDLGSKTKSWIIYLTVLLFVVHPIQTQSITYIVQRFTSLTAFFYLFTLTAYLKYRTASIDNKQRFAWYAFALLATLAAMKTKENAFTLPLMLVFIEAIYFRTGMKNSLARLFPFLSMLVVIPLSRLPDRVSAGFARQTLEIDRWEYLLTQFRVLITYLRLLVFPVNQNLDHHFPVYHSFFQAGVFLSFLLLTCLLVSALYVLFGPRNRPDFIFVLASKNHQRLHLISFGVLWFFLTLSIESSVIPIQDVIFEHRLYLPSIGFFLAASVVTETILFEIKFLQRKIILPVIVAAILIGILSVATFQRNRVWADEVTLWTDVTQKSPQKARGYNNLGVAYQDQGLYEEATSNFRIAVQRDPDYSDALSNLGYSLWKLGQLEEASKQLQLAIAKEPRNAHAYNSVGLISFDQNRFGPAITAFKKAIELKPVYVAAHNNLGLVYKKQGKPDEAIDAFRSAADLNPDAPEPRFNLGLVYARIGRYDEAESELRNGLRLDPDNIEGHYNLGVVYEKMHRYEEARQKYQYCLTLKPDFVPARKALRGLP